MIAYTLAGPVSIAEAVWTLVFLLASIRSGWMLRSVYVDWERQRNTEHPGANGLTPIANYLSLSAIWVEAINFGAKLSALAAGVASAAIYQPAPPSARAAIISLLILTGVLLAAQTEAAAYARREAGRIARDALEAERRARLPGEQRDPRLPGEQRDPRLPGDPRDTRHLAEEPQDRDPRDRRLEGDQPDSPPGDRLDSGA